MIVGNWWINNIEVVEIDDKLIALDGWNGEIYTNCFRVNPFDFKENKRGKTFFSYIGEKEYVVGIEYGEYLEDDENNQFATAIIGFEILEVN